MKTPLSSLAATTFILLFFNVCLFSQPTWEYFTGKRMLISLAARGNDILTCQLNGFGFYHLDTLGNTTHHTIQNGGVPFVTIDRVAIDADGGWWVAHAGGVARYDGVSWTAWDFADMGLPASVNNISIFETLNDGRVFACTNNAGPAVYENGAWSLLNTGNSGLPSNNVRDITADGNGNTYFATSSGLAVWNGNQWTIHNTTSTGITSFNSCTGVAVEPSGVLWVTAGLNRLVKYKNGVWTSYNAAALGLPTSLGLTGDVLFDPQGRQWLAYSKGVAVRQDTTWSYASDTLMGCLGSPSPELFNKLAIDGSGRVWSTLCDLHRHVVPADPEPMPHNNIVLPTFVFDITQDTSGVMWFAGGGGIARKDGDDWQFFDPMDLGLGTSSVNTAHGDAHGNVWFGGDLGVVFRYDGVNWMVFDTVAEVFPEFTSFWSIASSPDGTVWFSMLPPSVYRACLARYQNGAWTFFTPNNAPLPLYYDIVDIVVDDDGTAWFLAQNSLLRYEGATWTIFDPMDAGLTFSQLRRMVRGPDGALWITSDGGVLRFDGTSWTSLTATNSDIPTSDVYSIAFDALGGMYLGYDPAIPQANLGVLYNGDWTSLVPTGFEPGFTAYPWNFFTDRNFRLWYTHWPGSGIFMYDQMPVSTAPQIQSKPTGIRVYPNPATDAVTVVWKGLSGEGVRVRLLDPAGTVVLENTQIQGSEQIAVQLPASLPKGIYVAEVTDGFGRRGIGRFVRM